MNIVLLQLPIAESEIRLLIAEFPQYLFIAPSESEYNRLSDEIWERVEIIYGTQVSAEELKKAVKLRWIHFSLPDAFPLSLKEIEEKGNILITRTKEENAIQIAEYALAAALFFAKNLIYIKDAAQLEKWRDSMWLLKEKKFLQIGLGTVGTQIARLANKFEMSVWGVQKLKSYHTYCDKVFIPEDLNSLLPQADIVCFSPPRDWEQKKWLKQEEFALMKNDSLLIAITSGSMIDKEALIDNAQKFRGIVWDQREPSPKLQNLPNILLTSGNARFPELSKKEAFRSFRHNLRQYLHGNFSDMN